MRKISPLIALCALAACNSDPILGTWTGATDPTQTSTDYKLTLTTDTNSNYTFEEAYVTTNEADADSHAGCTVSTVYTGTFTDNPYDLGGVLALLRTGATFAYSGCADAADNAGATAVEAGDLDTGPARYLYRIKSKTLEMNIYGEPESEYVAYSKG